MYVSVYSRSLPPATPSFCWALVSNAGFRMCETEHARWPRNAYDAYIHAGHTLQWDKGP